MRKQLALMALLLLALQPVMAFYEEEGVINSRDSSAEVSITSLPDYGSNESEMLISPAPAQESQSIIELIINFFRNLFRF